jgi:hypothetical protein
MDTSIKNNAAEFYGNNAFHCRDIAFSIPPIIETVLHPHPKNAMENTVTSFSPKLLL